MKQALKHKLKIIIVFGVLFLVVIALLLLIFLAGKKTYTVTFDLNGGTLISGSTEQRVTQGHNATPPKVVKDGAYFLEWSSSYREVTKNLVIEAVWEYETTPGIVYTDSENQNFTEVLSVYKHVEGDFYLGGFYNEKKVLGIKEYAFSGCDKITSVNLLKGLLAIEKGAFSGCKNLKTIEIPSTVNVLSENLFEGCEKLETVILKEGLEEIQSGAFKGCTSLKEIIIPSSVVKISASAFEGLNDLVVKTYNLEEEKPLLWETGWNGNAEIVWGYLPETEEDKNSKNNK